jgi:hypothetical protein
MAGMFDLANIFQFVVDNFDDGTFAKYDFVGVRHDSAFHILFQTGDELYAIDKEHFKEFFSGISFVGKNFPNIFSKNLSFLTGSLSPTFLGAMTKLNNSSLSLMTMWSGRSAPLQALSPLRTVRESLPSHGSSNKYFISN